MNGQQSHNPQHNRSTSLPTRRALHAMLSMVAILTSGCSSLGALTAGDSVAIATADPVCKAAVTVVCMTEAEILALRAKTAASIAKNNEGLKSACPKVVKPCPKEFPPAIPPKTKPAEITAEGKVS